MTFYQLAFQYLRRKKGKTLLLFLVLILVNSMILSTSMILRAVEESKSSIQEQTGSKVIVEISDKDAKLSDTKIKQIHKLDGVTFVNRLSNSSAFPVNFNLITSSDSMEEDNLQVRLMSYDDLAKDSPFFEQRYRLIKGEYINNTTENGIVINSILAKSNELEVGDDMKFENSDGKQISAKIIGIFQAGNEDKQVKNLDSVYRIENQIYIDNKTYSSFIPDNYFYKVSAYTKDPEQINNLKTKMESLFPDDVEITTSDTLYKQLAIPLEQISRVSTLMLMLTLITGAVVVSLLLCMWMRSRQKEMAIFISMGKTKTGIYLQVLLESLSVFLVSVCGACGLGSLMAKMLKSLLTNSQTHDVVLNVLLSWQDIITLLILGGLIILAAVLVSLSTVIISNPKNILSRMEG